MSATDGAEGVECPICGKEYGSKPALNSHRGHAHPDETRVLVECEWCGDTERVQPNREDTYRFCSQECAGEWRSENVRGSSHPRWEGGEASVTCDQCGKDYTVPQYRKDATEFCPDCWGDGVSQTCQQCGEEFSVPNCRDGEARFCSEQCTGEWLSENITGEDHPRWAGGPALYGEGWNAEKKRRVRTRDQARCQSCGLTEPESLSANGCVLDVHHIQPARSFDDAEARNAMENLITLCRSCHRKWEGMAPLRPDTAVADG